MTEYTAETPALDNSQYCRAVSRGELTCIEVRHPSFSADILTQGAQLIHFAPTDEAPWIWLSPTAEYKRGISLRGGIPVCWPWFGDLNKNPAAIQALSASDNAPAHGFVRTQEWYLISVSETDSSVAITLAKEVADSLLWQANAALSLTITMTKKELTLSLTTSAIGQPLAITQALHTYFPTTDITATHIEGLDGALYTDALDGWQRKTQQGAIGFSGETDRIYQAPPAMVLRTPASVRQLTSSSHSAIVWNPWTDKSQRLSQFPDDAWRTMFCVESANALEDMVCLEAGESHTLTMSLQNA